MALVLCPHCSLLSGEEGGHSGHDMGLVAHSLTPECGTNAGAGRSRQRQPRAPLEQGWLPLLKKREVLLCSKILLCVHFPC